VIVEEFAILCFWHETMILSMYLPLIKNYFNLKV
jgi:hypothetical protein